MKMKYSTVIIRPCYKHRAYAVNTVEKLKEKKAGGGGGAGRRNRFLPEYPKDMLEMGLR